MKLVPIIMDYRLLQFDALKFFSDGGLFKLAFPAWFISTLSHFIILFIARLFFLRSETVQNVFLIWPLHHTLYTQDWKWGDQFTRNSTQPKPSSKFQAYNFYV